MQPISLPFYGGPIETDGVKLYSASSERNKEPILSVLKSLELGTKSRCRLLEIGSGAGQHACHFVAHLPHLEIQCTDVDPLALVSISAYAGELPETQKARIREPLLLSASDTTSHAPLASSSFDAVLSSNVVHISPPEVLEGLVALAGRVLNPRGLLCIYGPFLVNGQPTTESNKKFDETLKRMNPAYGLRDVDVIAKLGAAVGLIMEQRLEMPANNLFLVLRRA